MTGVFDRTMEELRIVARFLAEEADELLPVFERALDGTLPQGLSMKRDTALPACADGKESRHPLARALNEALRFLGHSHIRGVNSEASLSNA